MTDRPKRPPKRTGYAIEMVLTTWAIVGGKTRHTVLERSYDGSFPTIDAANAKYRKLKEKP